MMNKFNAKIPSQHFQEIHHALGRPWPEHIKGETYRNYFAAGTGSNEARRMKASPHWTLGSDAYGMTYFSVTDEGRDALFDYILQNVEVPRRYIVTYKHHEGQTVVRAKTPSEARYEAFLRSDTGLPFVRFANEVKSIRIYDRGTAPSSEH